MRPPFLVFPAILLAIMLSSDASRADTVSPLGARGFAVIPEPQRVTLQAGDFRFSSDWGLELGPGVPTNSTAVESLVDGMASRWRIPLKKTPGARSIIRLEVRAGSVTPGPSQDRNQETIAQQAYKLELSPPRIQITANAAPGLFYGVQTLLQLVRSQAGALMLPEGEILDWPDLEARHIYWDDAHHLERLDDLKAAVKQAAFFKINGFVIKLEGHFQYASAPALVEPQALSPADLQSLTDYGLRYHVQVIPYLDAPGHIAFILKHPEYASIREYPESNYELCATNPDSLKLLHGMYGDLLAANKGVSYFYLSTDEAYYSGLADNAQCGEARRAKELGSVGKVLAEFTTKAAGYLHDRGRTVVFWGEYPLKTSDISSLPSYLVNGETYGEAFDRAFKAHGIRQMIYQSTEGEERLFPHYYLLPPPERLHTLDEDWPRVSDAVGKIASDPARRHADLLGLVVAGWADMGLHPETFWLGYATITAAGWQPWSAGALEATSAFQPLFYGPNVTSMDRVYQLMSLQAQRWWDTWDTIESTARKPIWGNSYAIFSPPKPAHDQSIPLPPPPAKDLNYQGKWTIGNEPRLRSAAHGLSENDELLGLLHTNLRLASDHRYGLEVFVSIAQLCRQNFEMLNRLRHMDELLAQTSEAAGKNDSAHAIEAIDAALTEAEEIRHERNRVLHDTAATWGKSWLPRVAEANGRRFLHELDDVKDHLPDRTVDLSYLVYRELLLPFDEWYAQTLAARNQYASSHGAALRETVLDWKKTE